MALTNENTHTHRETHNVLVLEWLFHQTHTDTKKSTILETLLAFIIMTQL